MGPAEDWKFVAVQEPVKPVTGRLRDHYGVHERREDPDKVQWRRSQIMAHRCRLQVVSGIGIAHGE